MSVQIPNHDSLLDEPETQSSYRKGIEAAIAVVTNYHTYGFPRTHGEICAEIAAELQALLTKT